jgi:hypothetical protein
MSITPSRQGRLHRWVLWWFDAGLAIFAVVLANLPFFNLSRAQERVLFVFCVVNWLCSGLVCWACAGIPRGDAPYAKNSHPAHQPHHV